MDPSTGRTETARVGSGQTATHFGPKWISLMVRHTWSSGPLDAGAAAAEEEVAAVAGITIAPARPLPRTPMTPPARRIRPLRDKSLMLPPS